jgi:hypothetical protein
MGAVAQIYFLIFWIPAAASLVFLFKTWSLGILRRPLLLLAWFVLALLLQLWTQRFSPAWVAGLTLQAILAFHLVVRSKLDAAGK